MRLADRLRTMKRVRGGSPGEAQFIADLISKSVPVLADNVFDYVMAQPGPQVYTRLPCSIPPFKEMTVEWKSSGAGFYKRAMIISTQLSEDALAELRAEDGDGRLAMASRVYQLATVVELQGLEEPMMLRFFGAFSESGKLFDVAANGNTSRLLASVADDFLGNLVHLFVVFAQTMAFMHCKNSLLEDELRDAQLVKAQTRRMGMRPLQFKTLKIIPIERFRRGQASQPSGRDIALHIVRGHFKDYRERGLFGSEAHKGIYWWNQSLSGTAERYVEKTYDVHSPADDKAPDRSGTIVEKYAGTRLGRQGLDAEILDDSRDP